MRELLHPHSQCLFQKLEALCSSNVCQHLQHNFDPAVESKGGVEVLHKAEAHLKARHSAERILRCWGGQSKGSFDELKEGIHKMLQVGNSIL